MKIFSKPENFFFGYSYRENKTCYEKSMARAFRWLVCTVGKVMGLMLKKSCFQVMTWRHAFFSMTPWLYPLCRPIIWKPLPCSCKNRSCFHSSYNQKKVLCIEQKSFCYWTGMISYQWLDFRLACSMPAACLQHAQGYQSLFIGCTGHI